MRKYLPTLSELIDRLSIVQLKEVFIPEHKEEYAEEIKDIIHDLDLELSEKSVILSGDDIRSIIVLAQMNLHIWHNESNYRKGIKDGNNLPMDSLVLQIQRKTKYKKDSVVEKIIKRIV